jgi:hypothetical protein
MAANPYYHLVLHEEEDRCDWYSRHHTTYYVLFA